MGPIVLFDKSFLQSLSLDESLWFDNFFLAIVCPLFFVETLADLEKSVLEERTPEQEVGLIADKFPDMHGSPCVYHGDMCIGNLLGYEIPMNKRIPLTGGRLVKSGGKTGVIFELASEAETFSRWQNREFMEIERQYAKAWRTALSTLDLGKVARGFRRLGIYRKSCKTIEEAKALAESIVLNRENPFYCMELAFLFLGISQQDRHQILRSWRAAGCPPLAEYAPYAAHVLTVDLFFQIAVEASLISAERPSNRIDIAYLFYLPFCMIFVSSDRLHRRCAPLLLRDDQEFIWGPELKRGLSQLNEHYSQLSVAIKEQGVMSFASKPPRDGEYFVARIWDKHFPGWREREEVERTEKSRDDSKVLEEIREMTDKPVIPPDKIDFDPTDTDVLSLTRRVRIKKGSWYQVPKHLKNSKE